MDNDSIIRIATDLARSTILHNEIKDFDKVSELIKDYYRLLKELNEDTTCP